MQRTVGPFSARVVVPVRAATGGGFGPSPRQVRGPAWRRTSHGFYVPAGTARTPEQRVAEASVVVPVGGAITGWAALRWMGGRWFEGTTDGGRVELPVPIVAPSARIRHQPGIVVSREPLAPCDLIHYDGLWLTTPAYSAAFAMRHAPSQVEAQVVADMVPFSNLASIVEMGRHLDTHPRMHGSPLARAALRLAHENTWSPMETRLRNLWRVDAGLPPVLVNAAVFDLDGRHVGTPDLLDVEAGLVIEYDGREFHNGSRSMSDNEREDDLRAVGLSYTTVLGGQFHDRHQLVLRLQRARVRALAEQRSPREWTAEPPPWWILLDTVERRRRTQGSQWLRLVAPPPTPSPAR